jgi:hypothetical protein
VKRIFGAGLALAAAAAASAMPLPIPTELWPGRIHVRGFLSAIEWSRYSELPEHVADAATLVTWDGTELRGAQIGEWFATEFAGDGCHPLVRTDPGYLNDNSIFVGQDDGNSLEYRPIACSRSRFKAANPTHTRQMVMRFTLPSEGRISRIEIIK